VVVIVESPSGHGSIDTRVEGAKPSVGV